MTQLHFSLRSSSNLQEICTFSNCSKNLDVEFDLNVPLDDFNLNEISTFNLNEVLDDNFAQEQSTFDDLLDVEDLLDEDLHDNQAQQEQNDEECFQEDEPEEQQETAGKNQSTSSSTLTFDDFEGSLVGFTTKTLEEMHDIYEKHASIVGFSVRCHTTRCFRGTLTISEKYWVCSAHGERHTGEPNNKKQDNLTNEINEDTRKKRRKPRKVAVTRTDCKAGIRVKCNKEGLYEVVHHVVAHNHELTRKDDNHLHRSQRSMTKEKATTIEQMKDAGLSAMDSYRLMCEEAGGEDCVGHTVRDHLNYYNKLKMKNIEGGDAQSLIEIMYEQLAKDSEFFFRVRLDKFGKVTSIFWRDSMMLEDYKIYGDVVVFDTTYRTNRYNLICAPIVGINNHWKNVMFGCAFIGDEKTATFVWLLETFKKSMEQKMPVTIFTDQDMAMSTAISKVFPDTRHRLCIWHLHQNAIVRFGQLKRDATFKNTFNTCLKKCETIVAFEESWKEMLETYNLTEHQWFARVYELKEKWCPAYNKDFFSAGILSSQRSESTNHAIGFQAKRSTSLTEFYSLFENTIKRWRSVERSLEFNCTISKPSSTFPIMSSMLKHASEFYTLSLFRDFEREFSYAMATSLRKIGRSEFEVWLENKPLTLQQVIYEEETTSVSCTCKNFEASGWLCYHSLRILHYHSVQRIPEQYIKKRWTKYAKTEVWDRLESRNLEQIQYAPWRQNIARRYYNLVLKSEHNEEARKVVEENQKNLFNIITELIEAAAIEEQEANAIEDDVQQEGQAEANNSESIPVVYDPKLATTKGRNKRKKGPLETSKKRKNNNSNTNTTKSKNTTKTQRKEFGAKTPIPRLF